ncbi:MAG TPA: patatin-like phospholipase family protein [Bryobacteraceae bacterium]|nr:patatin-like phospholipase family protein [Bryobacteraceae bacterium]
MAKALVLGGGGPVGVAWEAGLIAGLAEGGVDVSSADFVVGTSAGSFVGAQLALGRSPAEIAAPDLAGAIRPPQSNAPAPDLTMLLAKLMEAASGARPAEEVRAELGAWALQTPAISEEEFMARFAPALGGEFDGAWPAKSYACTAVDTADGSFMVWNKDAGIGLARAVASSCAVPGIFPPISFRGRRYMDGGMRSGTNSDLAKGFEVVIVVSVTGRMMPGPFRSRFDGEMQKLRDGGSRVEVVLPDDESAAAFGINLMDASRRQPSAQAGLRQGRIEAPRLTGFWR